jgi:putative Mg2+ transporter-C (MgtC) family protein
MTGQADVSRVVQGVITGVGFIGDGVIFHHATNGKVHGLTTAASIWVTVALGVLCGLAAWKLLVVALAGVVFLLLAGGPIERWCQKALGIEEKDPPGSR